VTALDAIAAHVPAGARVLVVGPDAVPGLDGAQAVGLAAAEAGTLPEGPFDLLVLADVLGLADDPAALVATLRQAAGSDAPVLVVEPDAELAAREPAVLAGERRRRFTRATLEGALGEAGLAVVAWPAVPAGQLAARTVGAEDGAVLAGLRREVEELRADAGRRTELAAERDALQARVVALEARERELRDRLLAAHELLGSRDADVVRLAESERELRNVQGTVVWRAGWRYWHLKGAARRVAARAKRELRG
jgi:hypothetical protein